MGSNYKSIADDAYGRCTYIGTSTYFVYLYENVMACFDNLRNTTPYCE